MTKKIFITLALILILPFTLMLSGCSGKDDDKTPETPLSEIVSNQKYSLELFPEGNYMIELVSPSMEQFEQNEGKINAGTRVVLNCEIFQDGYELKSWNVVDASGNKVSVDSNNSFIMPNSNVQVSAVVEEKTYMVSIDNETAKIIDVTMKDENNNVIENGSSVKYFTRIYLSYEFKTEGYTFAGWKDQNNRSISSPFYIQNNIVISANFNAKEYTLSVDNRWNDPVLGEGQTLNARGGKSLYLTKANGQTINPKYSNYDNNQPVSKASTGEEITIQCETRNINFGVDYYILSYYKDGSLYDEHITTNKFNMPAKNVTVSVQIKRVENTYSVNYVLDDGKMPPYAPRTFKSTDNSLDIPNPTKTGYRFTGWAEQNSMSHQSLEGAMAFNPDEITDNLTLTATWVKVVKINYVLGEFNGMNNYYVTNPNPKDYAVEDGNLILKDASHQYASFEGWYKNENFTDKVTSIQYNSLNNLSEITLYAKFETKLNNIQYKCVCFAPSGRTANPYLDSFKQNGFLCFVDIQYTPNKDLSDEDCMSKVTIRGYEFKGFYTSPNCLDSEKVTEISFTEGAMLLYAKQELQEYKITYVDTEITPGTPFTYERTYTVEDNFDLEQPNSIYRNGGWVPFKYWDYSEGYAHLTHINPGDYCKDLYLIAVYGN